MNRLTGVRPAGELALAESPLPLGAAWDYLELTKPRLTSLVGLTALVGFVSGSPGPLEAGPLAASLAGTTLLAAGGCVFNQVMERDLDALMERTRSRPLPAGRLRPLDASIFGAALTAAGGLLLAAGTNLLTFLLGLAAVVSYLAIYTPLKQTTGLCTLVGAIPGALPPAMGWTAAAGRVDPGTWALFGLLFLWQLPHFLAIAWRRRDDYARAGFPMLTVIDPEGGSAGRQAVLYCLALIPVSLMPTMLGFAGPWYFFCALALGLLYLSGAARLALRCTDASARSLFLTSLAYLPLVLTVMMLDRVIR